MLSLELFSMIFGSKWVRGGRPLRVSINDPYVSAINFPLLGFISSILSESPLKTSVFGFFPRATNDTQWTRSGRNIPPPFMCSTAEYFLTHAKNVLLFLGYFFYGWTTYIFMVFFQWSRLLIFSGNVYK